MSWQRGDVVWCKVPMPSTEYQEFKNRPAVIVSADSLNRVLDDVMIIPCTTNTSNRNRTLKRTHYLITGDEVMAVGIVYESIVRCESIFTLNKSMIRGKAGSLSPETIAKINGCLSTALQIS